MIPLLGKVATDTDGCVISNRSLYFDEHTCEERNDGIRLVNQVISIQESTSATAVARETTDDD